MKSTGNFFVALILLAFACGLILSYSGCSKLSPLAPDEVLNDDAPGSVLFKSKVKKDSKHEIISSTYPQWDEKTYHWVSDWDGYAGGTMKLANGSQFHVYDYSLTPPEGTPSGEPVTLTMEVEKIGEGEDTQFVYTFGPPGSTFSPPAVIRLDWQDLGLDEEPDFYYIDAKGRYHKQDPDAVDMKNKKLILYVDHFSRYAVAHSQ